MECIKFRAYNEELNEMTYSDHEGGLRQFFDYVYDYNIKLMPSTGVKDINKKESYLGDILKEKIHEWSSKRDLEHTKKCFCIIKKESDSNNMYLEYNFNIRGYWETNNLVLGRIGNYEIVGNVFENADMIKKEV